MQVIELENKGLKRSFRIVVDAERIASETESELKRAGEQVKMPGFRPGFVPLKVLKQRYGKSIEADVLKNLVGEVTHDVLTERKLRPAMTPDVQVEDYREGGEFSFTVSFEIIPDMPEIDFSAITLDRLTFEVSESDVDEMVQKVAERNPDLEPAAEGAKAEKGQVVTIDFLGRIDGKAFDGGSAEGFKLELGSDRFIPGFEDQLIGIKAGEKRDVKVTFPAEYPHKDVAGKEAVFEVNVHAVEVFKTPVVDEDFAKQRGFADLRAFREAIRSRLVHEYNQVVRRRLKKQLFDRLDERCACDLPEGMVHAEFKSIWDRIMEAKKSGDPSLKDKSDDALKNEYTAIARRRVKLGLLLAEIAQRHQIKVSNEELNRAVMQQASQFPGEEKKVVDFYRKNAEQLAALRGPILEEKSVDYVLGKVAYHDQPSTLKQMDALEDADEGGED